MFDIAKGLIDKGFHPPTIYFPLNVPEAIMIEPTETEDLDTLDRFSVLKELFEVADKNQSLFIRHQLQHLSVD